MATDQDTSFASGASHGQAEAARTPRGYFEFPAHVAERTAIVADRSQQYVAGRADVRFRNTPNILQ
jgi:hypothetical protein